MRKFGPFSNEMIEAVRAMAERGIDRGKNPQVPADIVISLCDETLAARKRAKKGRTKGKKI